VTTKLLTLKKTLLFIDNQPIKHDEKNLILLKM